MNNDVLDIKVGGKTYTVPRSPRRDEGAILYLFEKVGMVPSAENFEGMLTALVECNPPNLVRTYLTLLAKFTPEQKAEVVQWLETVDRIVNAVDVE